MKSMNMSKFVEFCKKNNRLVLCLGVVIYFVVMLSVMAYFEIPCVFRHFFGLYCPGCGMTRAALSVLRLDFLSALYYNPLVFSLPYIALYIVCDFKGKAHKYILAAIAALFVLNWVIRLAVPALQAV